MEIPNEPILDENLNYDIVYAIPLLPTEIIYCSWISFILDSERIEEYRYRYIGFTIMFLCQWILNWMFDIIDTYLLILVLLWCFFFGMSINFKLKVCSDHTLYGVVFDSNLNVVGTSGILFFKNIRTFYNLEKREYLCNIGFY